MVFFSDSMVFPDQGPSKMKGKTNPGGGGGGNLNLFQRLSPCVTIISGRCLILKDCKTKAGNHIPADSNSISVNQIVIFKFALPAVH